MKKYTKSRRESLKEKALDHLQSHIADMQMLQDFREYADKAYQGAPISDDGKELKDQKGRSSIKMSDVFDTVEWIMPTMMRIFYGGQKVAECRPVGKDDEVKAKIMEEKINFDFMRMNDGFTILHDWFKDAMLSKAAAVKYWWEEKTEKKKRTFEGLTQIEYEALQDDENFEVVETEEVEQTAFNGVEDVTLKFYNVTANQLIKRTRPVVQNLPPEEFIFDITEKGKFTEESFCAHRKRVHKNYLKSKYKLKDADIEGELMHFDENTLKETRFEDLGGVNYIRDENDDDHVFIYECYMPEYDDEGQPVPMKVTVFGNQAIDVAENTYSKPPFCVLTSIRKPYRMVGMSLAGLVMEIQKLRTALVRQIMDNIYYQNNAVKVINPYRIDLDDVIDHNHPGGIWRTRYDIEPSRAIHNVDVTPLASQTQNMLEWVETIKENRTGVTKYNQGLDSKSLNKTATGISQIMSASQQRMELMARIFSETGVKDLFQALVDMNLDFFDHETSIKVSEEWVDITPEMIDGKFDVLIDVGVGTGTNEVKIGQITNMLNVSVPAVEMGVVSPDNIYNMIAKIWELMGYKNTDKFVTRPGQNGLPPEVVQAMLQIMQQQGVDVNGLIQTAAQAVQGNQGQNGNGGQAAPGQRPNQNVL